MSKVVTQDPLTGLATREDMRFAVKRSIQAEEPVALALIDLDHFMEINDTLGHDEGDHVLIGLSRLLEEHFPGQAYRVSGDEFAVIVTGASLEQAFLKLEGLRQIVHASQDKLLSQPSGPLEVTITAGVAQYPRDAKTLDGLIRCADAALSNAKENGRNQVSLPPNEEMIMKSCYYPSTMVRRLKTLADKLKKKESVLLREALGDLLHKYDRVGQ